MESNAIIETLLPFCGEGMKVEVRYSGKSPWKPVDLKDQTVAIFGESLSIFKDSPPTGFQIPFNEIERVEAKDGSLEVDAIWSAGKYPMHLKIRKSYMNKGKVNADELDSICGEGLVVHISYVWNGDPSERCFKDDYLILDARVVVEGDNAVVYGIDGKEQLRMPLKTLEWSWIEESVPCCAKLHSKTSCDYNLWVRIMRPEWFNDPKNGNWAAPEVMEALSRVCGEGRRIVDLPGTYSEKHTENVDLALRGNILLENGEATDPDGLREGTRVLLETSDGVMVEKPHGYRYAIVKDSAWETYRRFIDSWFKSSSAEPVDDYEVDERAALRGVYASTKSFGCGKMWK